MTREQHLVMVLNQVAIDVTRCEKALTSHNEVRNIRDALETVNKLIIQELKKHE